jgi:hypothetical protein
MADNSDVRPFVTGASAAQVAAILGAMRAVAETDGALSDADNRTLAGASVYLFGQAQPLDVANLIAVTPAALATVIPDPVLRDNALKFLTIMAFVDGRLDKAKIARVIDYAKALGIDEDYLDDIAEAARGHVQEALAHMVRSNLQSITGKDWGPQADETAWLVPYKDRPEPDLVARFEKLGKLAQGTFGRAFYEHYHGNGYDFPGAPEGLNFAFGVPHDSAHVLSGYNTTARGELLVSTFTAGMHPHQPMAGHILPVIFSWHLDIQINPVAKSAQGALDPDQFWHAWAAGKTCTIDTFAPDWDFWRYVEAPLIDLRRQWSIPEHGLDHHDVALRQ